MQISSKLFFSSLSKASEEVDHLFSVPTSRSLASIPTLVAACLSFCCSSVMAHFEANQLPSDFYSVIDISPYSASSAWDASPIKRYLGGTSDHSWKTYAVELIGNNEGDDLFQLKIGTWNLLDRCSYNPSSGFGNNPLNVVEDDREYLLRKRIQFKEIEKLIRGGVFNEQPVSGIDVLAFQEVNFYYIGAKAQYRFEKGLQISEWQEIERRVYLEFKKMLSRCGWEMIATSPRVDKHKQDPLVVVYNPKVIESSALYLEGCFLQERSFGSSQFRGGEVEFIHRASRRNVVITNLHLDYSVNPQEQVTEYQEEQIKKGLPTLAIGDLNRPPNKGFFSAIADWNYPTNTDTLNVADRGDPTKLSLKDAQDPHLNKVYDALLVSPGHREEVVAVKETEMAYFEKDPVGEGMKLSYTNVQRQHFTPPGKPWLRRKVME